MTTPEPMSREPVPQPPILTEAEEQAIWNVAKNGTHYQELWAVLASHKALRARVEELEKKCDEKSDQISADTSRFITVTHRIKELCPQATSLENGIECLATALSRVTGERDDTQEELRLTIEQRDHLHLEALELEKVWEAAKHRFLRIEQQLAERDARIAKLEDAMVRVYRYNVACAAGVEQVCDEYDFGE